MNDGYPKEHIEDRRENKPTTEPTHFRRRKDDHTAWSNFKYKFLHADIFMVLVLGALGLIAWVVFGLTAARNDLTNYAAMFPIGGWEFWVSAYLIAAFGMLYIAAKNMPPMASLMIGGWIICIWSWSFFARALNVYTAQTGNATSITYIIIGVLIIQRSSRNVR